MTNGDKFLRDGVDYIELSRQLSDYIYDKSPVKKCVFPDEIVKFFEQEIMPTLTEDERVILRNIQKGLFREGFISRTTGNELFVFIKETGETIELYIFNHLFQFIKERRRIRNS